MRRSLRLYRLLLKLYPAAFREHYEAPLERQFKDDLAEVHGTRGAARFWLATLADFAQSMPPQLAREVVQDGRHALRRWRRRPLAATFSVAVLTIAIGVNTGVFSVVNALLLRSLPYQDPGRLAVLQSYGPPREGFHEWHRQSAYLADAAMYDTGDVAGRQRLPGRVDGHDDGVGRGHRPSGSGRVAVLPRRARTCPAGAGRALGQRHRIAAFRDRRSQWPSRRSCRQLPCGPRPVMSPVWTSAMCCGPSQPSRLALASVSSTYGASNQLSAGSWKLEADNRLHQNWDLTPMRSPAWLLSPADY